MTIIWLAQENVHDLQGILFFPIKWIIFSKTDFSVWMEEKYMELTIFPFLFSSSLVYFMLYEFHNKCSWTSMGKIYFSGEKQFGELR